nr:transcriptional regulator [uncultured Campylobacter sp.]
MTVEEVKEFCKEYGFTYGELAQKIGWGEASLRTTIGNGKISEQTAAAIELLRENIALKAELEEWRLLKNTLKKALS